MGLYTIIDGINNEILFKYILVILFSIFFFKSKNIGLNVIFAIFIAVVFIAYNYDEINVKREIKEKQQETKQRNIQPTPQHFMDKDDLIDLLYSIQDFYHYNPQSFEELVDNLDSFFRLYTAIKRGSQFCDQYYQIAESKKDNSLNALHSLIFSIPNHKIVTDKFNRAHKRLETIMNYYINELYDVCKRDLLKNGYNVERREINTGPKEFNQYYDKYFSYKFY